MSILPPLHLRHELSEAELRRGAPSIFASQPIPHASSRYTFLPTAFVVARMREEGWAPVWAREQRVRSEARRGFQKHAIRFLRRDTVAVKDEYAVEICLVNSHDCTCAYTVHAALYRFICGNGMMVPDSVFQHVSIRHAGFTPDEVIEASFRVLEIIPNIVSNIELFRSIELELDGAVRFAKDALSLRYEKLQTAPIRPWQLLTARRSDDEGFDLWHVLCRVQENLMRGGFRSESHLKPMRPIVAIDRSLRINKGLWELARHAVPQLAMAL